MTPAPAELQPTDDPTIYTSAGRRFHVPGHRFGKRLFLAAGVVVFVLGIAMIWPALGRFLTGERVEGRVVRIVKVVPGRPDEVVRYRRAFPPERDRSIVFRHYVQVNSAEGPLVLRLAVDSRVQPAVNVNDRLKVMYDPGDVYAFAVGDARTWGIGVTYVFIGCTWLALAIPMLRAVGRPIEIDPEADPEGSEGAPSQRTQDA